MAFLQLIVVTHAVNLLNNRFHHVRITKDGSLIFVKFQNNSFSITYFNIVDLVKHEKYYMISSLKMKSNGPISSVLLILAYKIIGLTESRYNRLICDLFLNSLKEASLFLELQLIICCSCGTRNIICSKI